MEMTAVLNDHAKKQPAPGFSFPGLEDQYLVYQALGLAYHHFSNMARIVTTDNAFLVLEVENEHVLKNLSPDREMIAGLCGRYGLIGFTIFSLPNFAPGVDATTRMFTSTYTTDKEWATVTAAGPLACYLHKFVKKKNSYTIEEGKFRRPYAPGLIGVNLVVNNHTIVELYTTVCTQHEYAKTVF